MIVRLLKTHPLPEAREAFRRHGRMFEPGELGSVVKEVGLRKHDGVVAVSRINNKRHLLRRGSDLDVGAFRCGYLYGINHPLLGENTAER